MPKYQLTQTLTDWTGDTPSLIAEMKRRAGVRTDRDLATFMGVAQSTVSHWRARGQVAESAVLRFEKQMATQLEPDASRAIAARMVAIRVADYWDSTLDGASVPGRRLVVFGTVAGAFHTITDQIYENLLKHERLSGLDAWEVADRMIEDDRFLEQVTDWIGSISLAAGLKREAMSPPLVRLQTTLEFPNPVSQSVAGGKKAK